MTYHINLAYLCQKTIFKNTIYHIIYNVRPIVRIVNNAKYRETQMYFFKYIVTLSITEKVG